MLLIISDRRLIWMSILTGEYSFGMLAIFIAWISKSAFLFFDCLDCFDFRRCELFLPLDFDLMLFSVVTLSEMRLGNCRY